MSPIDPAELSAFLDGELTPERAACVREAIAREPALKAEFERLQAMDAAWQAAGREAAFWPQVSLPAGATGRSIWMLALGVVAMIALHVLPKAFDAAMLGVTVNAVALMVVLRWVVGFSAATDIQALPAGGGTHREA